jgi:predicted SprT family Zn-dependent metalloprotease
MELPNQIIIKNKKWDIIKLTKQDPETKQIDGEADLDKQTIKLNIDLDHDELLTTILHELFHVIFFNHNLRLKQRTEEKYVDIFSKDLVKILLNKKNKKLLNAVKELL